MASWACGSLLGSRAQPFPSGIGQLDLHSNLGGKSGTGSAWFLAGAAGQALSTLERQQMPYINVGINAHLDPSNCTPAVDRGHDGTVFPQLKLGCILMHCNL